MKNILGHLFKDREEFEKYYRSLDKRKQRIVIELCNHYRNLKKSLRIHWYKPHKKQKQFHNINAKIKLMLGGNRSGKTVAGAAEVVYHATQKYPDWWKSKKFTKPTNGWVVSLDNNVQLEVTQKEIAKWLPQKDIDYIIGDHRSRIDQISFEKCLKLASTVFLKNGSTIGFKNCEAGRQKFQGTSKDYIWLDEEPPEDIFKECKARTIDCEGRIIITMTPLQGYTWVYKDIYQNQIPGIHEVVEVRMDENKYLPKAEVTIYQSTLDEKEQRMRMEGQFCALGGLVFNEFDRGIHVIEHFEPEEGYNYFMGGDFGTRHETAIPYIAMDYEDNIYIFDEYYESNQDFDTHATRIKQKMGTKVFRLKVMDSAATQAILEFKRRKLNFIPVKKIKGFKEAARSMIKEKLKNRSLFISDRCINMIYEFEHYRYKEEKQGNNDTEDVIKKEDHLIDALQYIIFMLQYREKPDKVEVNTIEGRRHIYEREKENSKKRKHKPDYSTYLNV